MGTFLIILIVLYLVWFLFREPISRWFRSYMSRRTEDMIRRMMGMPTRKEEKRRRKEQERRRKETGRNGYGPTRHPQNHPAEMMKSVAVDVEYTEIKEFNSTTIVEDQNDNTKIITEEQITDVEFTEIKSKQ